MLKNGYYICSTLWTRVKKSAVIKINLVIASVVMMSLKNGNLCCLDEADFNLEIEIVIRGRSQTMLANFLLF